MGFLKDLFGGGLNQPSEADPAGGNGMLAKLFNEHPELQGGNQKKYTYDANAQQYTAMKQGGKVSTASKRADGCATKGKTKGRFV
jgi:hypothetical protein